MRGRHRLKRKGQWPPEASLLGSDGCLTAMGNVCGCVRGPKEECQVDPTKAPLSPGSEERGAGRRYFQRRRKRKSSQFQPSDSLRSWGSADGCECESRAAPAPHVEMASDSCGVYVGEVPVVLSMIRRPPHFREAERGSSHRAAGVSALGDQLHGVAKASRWPGPKDSPVQRRLRQKQVRRSLTFGAVEHLLQAAGEGGGTAERVSGPCPQRRRAGCSSTENLPTGKVAGVSRSSERTGTRRNVSRRVSYSRGSWDISQDAWTRIPRQCEVNRSRDGGALHASSACSRAKCLCSL